MPRLKVHWPPPNPASLQRLEFIELRDQFRAHGLELFRDHGAERYELRQGRDVLATVLTLSAARRWLQHRGS